jgi:hypothetical protein
MDAKLRNQRIEEHFYITTSIENVPVGDYFLVFGLTTDRGFYYQKISPKHAVCYCIDVENLDTSIRLIKDIWTYKNLECIYHSRYIYKLLFG